MLAPCCKIMVACKISSGGSRQNWDNFRTALIEQPWMQKPNLGRKLKMMKLFLNSWRNSFLKGCRQTFVPEAAQRSCHGSYEAIFSGIKALAVLEYSSGGCNRATSISNKFTFRAEGHLGWSKNNNPFRWEAQTVLRYVPLYNLSLPLKYPIRSCHSWD